MIRHICGLLLIVLLLFTCKDRESFITDAEAQLEFSLDTLRFDTVFTELGSATRIIKVYNTHKQSIRIDRIFIRDGANSFFRMNVDGISTRDIKDIEIAPEDSLYIFSEVTIDPDMDISISPYVVEDEVIFQTNGNTQSVHLEAWGQNANYIPSRFGAGGISGVNNCMGIDWVWDDPKPYVIYGILVVDDCTLRIPAGARVYVHGGLQRIRVPNPVTMGRDSVSQFYNDGRLLIGPRGKLIVEGTAEDPVIIQGDRLEEPFQDVEGQWFGIVLTAGSKGNEIRHAEIKNAVFGVYVDSAANLSVESTQFYNTISSGLIGVHADIDATNCLFYNNGSGSFQAIYGGDYDFNYCTLASYGVDASALSLTNALCLDQLCSEYRAYRLRANFTNSIIFGSRNDEISLGAVPEAAFTYNFDHCIVKVDELDDNEPYMDFLDDCTDCLNADRDAPLFADLNEDDYHLDTLSIAEGIAQPLSGIQLDLENNERDMDMPDVGCYEYQYK